MDLSMEEFRYTRTVLRNRILGRRPWCFVKDDCGAICKADLVSTDKEDDNFFFVRACSVEFKTPTTLLRERHCNLVA